MSDIALFLVGFIVFAIAFVGSLSYAYMLVSGTYEVDRLQPDDAFAIDALDLP